MDFFGAQASARRRSRVLGLAFTACVLAVVFVLDWVVLGILRLAYASGDHPEPMHDSLAEWALLHPGTVVLSSLAIGGFIGVASLIRMLQLRDGGAFVARSVGGVRVEHDTPDPRRRQLYNVVEEMALASGVPVPEVYVLERETGINAFAAGHTPASSAIAVTRGALRHLNRDQLQGVIAHEFSHILHGDTRLSMRLIGFVFGLMAIALAGRLLMRLSYNERRPAWPVMLLGLTIAAVGQIGFWAGRLLQAWISRTRETLADAAAVQFTRNPEGLRDALVRAAALGPGRRLASAGMEEVAHMLFVPAARRFLATHPPLLERIAALDPQVNQGALDAMLRRATAQLAEEEAAPPDPPAAPAVRGVPVSAAAALIAATTGDPAPQHLERAVALRRALPSSLRASAGEPERAQALALALVIHADTRGREAQLQAVRGTLGDAWVARVQQDAPLASDLEPMLRLPAVLQLVPGLRALAPLERATFISLLRRLMRADDGLSVFEYALEKILLRALENSPRTREPHGSLGLADCADALGVVFSVLATQGATGHTAARKAYEAGMATLLPRHRPAFSLLEDWVPLFDGALDRLCGLRVAAKQLLIEALVRTIAHDDLLTPSEAELLRAICAVLECPLPPVLPPPARD